MIPSDVPRAVAAGMAAATAAGLDVDDATVIQDSDRIVARLLPADVVVRVAYDRRPEGPGFEVPGFEVEVARCLGAAGGPVGTLDPRVEPRVHLHDGFAVTFWTYYEPLPARIDPPQYAAALLALHASMRQAELVAPHFTDRVAAAQTMLGDRTRTPQLGDEDRELLSTLLQQRTASITGRGASEQLLHGEPHPGNLIPTRMGPLFVDLGTAVRGPVEFDLAHAPEHVGHYYPGTDKDLLRDCRILMLAMVTTWRWDRDDQLPDGRRLAMEWLGRVRAARDRRGPDPSP